MLFRLLADVVVVVHLGFVLFAVVGGLLVLWRHWLAWFHLPAAGWAALIEFAGWICPLTPLENWLRMRGGSAAYAGSFVETYLWALLYPAELTRSTQITLGAGVLLINVFVYGWILLRMRRRN